MNLCDNVSGNKIQPLDGNDYINETLRSEHKMHYVV